jgi:hypothetical protein
MPSTRVPGIKNLLAGLAVCGTCGSSMTRVTKGSRARSGRPYLVCTKAKLGAGCRYVAVPLDPVENELRNWLKTPHVWQPDPVTEANMEVNAAESELRELDRKVDTFVNLIAQTQTPELVKLLDDAQRRRIELKARVAELPLMGLVFPRRMDDVRKAADSPAPELNILLRQVLKKIDIAYSDRRGLMSLVWKNGQESSVFIG